MSKGLERFDRDSGRWDDNPNRIEMARNICNVIREQVPLRLDMDIMDYGCGTGLVSLCLAPFVSTLLGVDGSSGMIAQFQKKIDASHQNDSILNCTARSFDPSRETIPVTDEERVKKFHLIYSTMTFHHIEDIKKILKEFLLLLKPEGQVAIIDLETEDGSFHQDPNAGVFHCGFDPDAFAQTMKSVGFQHVSVSRALIHTRKSTGKTYPLFIARGD